ncbi:MAG: WG repeat-containing protein [Muribaculaceae bacterium]|nr:WG repeat-containing protein [Muribaculaceae bacterium]
MTRTTTNPYIGLRTYEETDAMIFRGRSAAASELYRMIVDNDVVVLHAESGEGKSSLLNAGLFPMLREERYFPIKVNFTDEDFALESPNFDEIVYRRIMDAIDQAGRGASGVVMSLAPLPGVAFDSLKENIWWLLRNYVLTAFGAQLTPILVFDQFEEVFTRPAHISWTEDFFGWLATTLSDSIPDVVASAIRADIGPDAAFPHIHTRKRFKALFSQRTEFMGELDYWGIQRHSIAVLKNSRYCLKPLTEAEADEVLALQPAFTPEVREKLKSAISSSQRSSRRPGTLPLIPAMLLSVVSTTASESIGKAGSPLGALDGAADAADGKNDVFLSIISQFYDKEIADTRLPKKDIAVIEDVLVDDKGKRVRIKADAVQLRAIGFEEKYKGVLEQKRLLKSSRINGDEYVELTHDALARVVMRRRRRERDERNNYIELGLFATVSMLAVYFLIICMRWTTGLSVMQLSDPFDLCYRDMYIRPGAFVGELRNLVFYLLAIFVVGKLFSHRGWVAKVSGIIILVPLFFALCLTKAGAFLLLFISVFGLAPYCLMRERNGVWCCLIAVGCVFWSLVAFIRLFYSVGYMSMLLILMMILALVILGIYSLRQPRKRSFSEALGMVFRGEVFRQHKRLYVLLGCFLLLLLLNIAAAVGAYAHLGVSLVVVPLFALAAYQLYCRLILRSRSEAKPLVQDVIYLSVLAIGLSYMVTWQLFAKIGILAASFIFIYKELLRRWYRSVSVWVICVLFVSLLGYGILPSRDGTYIASMKPIEDESGVRLLRVKDKAGRHGLQDRRGRTVIACEYDTIIPCYEWSRKGATSYLLRKDGLYSRWRVFHHYPEINCLTNRYVARFVGGELDKSRFSSQAYPYDNPDVSKIILGALKARKLSHEDLAAGAVSNRLLQRINKTYDTNYWQLNDGDTTFMARLSSINYDKACLGLLPYASEGFQEEFMKVYFPKLEFWGETKVGDVLNTDPDSLTLNRYRRYRLGDLYRRLAAYCLETAQYDRSLHYSELAMRHGAFAEPAVVDSIVAALLKGDPHALDRVKVDPIELIRINRGPTYPDPELEDAWVFLRYRPLYDLVSDRIDQLRLPQNIPAPALDRAADALRQIPRGEAFESRAELPYTAVQLLPDSLGGGRRYFGNYLPDMSYGRNHAGGHEYSFFVKDGKIEGLPMMWYSFARDYSDAPVLVIDPLTGRRRYIKSGYDIVEARSGAPESLPGEYSHAWSFSEGLAAVEVDGKIGFIDESGRMVIEPRFVPRYPTGSKVEQELLDVYVRSRSSRHKPSPRMPFFHDGECTVYDGTEFITIDREGNRVVPAMEE